MIRGKKSVIPGLLISLMLMITCCCWLSAFAQEKNYITGKVLNGESDAVVQNASVFITNTSKGTITSASGSFELRSIPPGKYDLIISSVGYNTQVYSFSSDKLPLQLKIYLQPKVTELDAVVVQPYEKDGWEKWGKFFIENFLGTTDAAKLCKIRNPKVLRFRNSKKTNTLSVAAIEPLVIENRELGYKITYQLEEFSYHFGEQTLFYLGYTLFEDMAKNPDKIPKRFLKERQKAYNGSIVHFIRSLYNNQLSQNGFEVKRMHRVYNTERERVRAITKGHPRIGSAGSGFRITKVDNSRMRPVDSAMEKAAAATNAAAKQRGSDRNPWADPDSSNYYDKILAQKEYEEIFSRHNLVADSLVTVSSDGQQVLFFENYIHVMYKQGFEEAGYLLYSGERRKVFHPRSFVSLLNGKPVAIEKNGTCLPPTEFFSSGYWSWSEKISHLLPADYDEKTGR